jgi:hypothetical protein
MSVFDVVMWRKNGKLLHPLQGQLHLPSLFHVSFPKIRPNKLVGCFEWCLLQNNDPAHIQGVLLQSHAILLRFSLYAEWRTTHYLHQLRPSTSLVRKPGKMLGDTTVTATTDHSLHLLDAITCSRVLVIANISKETNVLRLAVTALAHNFVPIIVGYQDSISSEKIQSYLGREAVFYRASALGAVSEWLKRSGHPMVGIEITDKSVDITQVDVDPNAKVALMPGNEGTGLSSRQKECCDSFCLIPQYSASIESLNVHVATTIVLNSY